MPAAQREYFAGLIARLVGGRNQKIDCHLQTHWQPRRRVIGLVSCAARLKESLAHGGQCPRQKKLNVSVGHMVAEELSQALAICQWHVASTWRVI